jgi:hypothetical protein
MQSKSFLKFKSKCFDQSLYMTCINQGWCSPAFHGTYAITNKDEKYLFADVAHYTKKNTPESARGLHRHSFIVSLFLKYSFKE